MTNRETHFQEIADLCGGKSPRRSPKRRVGETGKKFSLRETSGRRSPGKRGRGAGRGGDGPQLYEGEEHADRKECEDVEKSIGQLQQCVYHEFFHLFGYTDEGVNL